MGLHKGEKYSEDIRKFALTLRFYSPRAYEYIREKFNRCLPHSVTIRKWYQQSNILASSGLCNRTLEILKGKVEELKMRGEKLYCGLIHDEMNLMQLVQWLRDKKSFSGFITFGKVLENADTLPIATQALVFLVTGINISFHLPIAYYFVSGLDGFDKVILMNSIGKALSDIGIIELTSTFDGHASNIVACELMGSSFGFDDFHPQYIKQESNEIFPFFDPPHMLKLIRNVLGEKKVMYDRHGRPIEWKYFEILVDLKEKDTLITHKMTKNHINYHQQKMKVSLAAQTFSNSTAISMQSLMNRKYPGFENSAGTIEFSKRLNNLFDVMNSNKKCDNIFKSPITAETSEEIISFLDDTADYLKKLTFEKGKKPIVESALKIGFKGMIVDIENVKQIYRKFVETKELEEFCACRVVQCPLESLFSRCRSHSMLGCNTNPSTVQFTSTIKKVLVNNEITSSVFANTIDQLDILYIPSSVPKKLPVNIFHAEKEVPPGTSSSTDIVSNHYDQVEANMSVDINIPNIDDCRDIDMNMDNDASALSTMNKFMGIACIAGEIDQRIERKFVIKCDLCCKVPAENESLTLDGFPTSKYNRLPCKSTYEICRIVNSIFEPHMLKIKFNYNEILCSSLNEIDQNYCFQNSSFSLHSGHKIQLIQSIVETYISIKSAYIARKVTLENRMKMIEENKRKKLSITKHFQGR